MAVAIDKISTMTLPDYAGLGAAIEGLTAKQAALVLSTRNLSELELEEVIIQNKLLEKYGAENLIKAGLISANSTLLASEKALTAEELEDLLVRKGVADVEAKRLIQQNLQIVTNGNETTSVVMLNKALMTEAIERGILTEEKAAEILSTLGVVTADGLEIGSKKSLLAVTGKLIAANARLIATTVGITALLAVWYKTSKAIEEAQQRAQELGEEFKNSKSEIENYKAKIKELHKTINDSNSSIEDVTNARKTLMSVQDELIDKFGTEKSVINDVTEAINGQTDALDRLTQAKWQELKNEFNDGGFWNGVANFFQITDNIERMLNEYGEKTIVFPWTEYVSKYLTDEMVAELENIGVDIEVRTDNLQGVRSFDSLTESILNTKGASLAITGNAEEIYNKLLALQNLIGDDDTFDKLYDRVERSANSYKKLTDQYRDFYNQYILYEKILTDNSNYADVFNEITKAHDEYSNAFASGDESKIKEAADNYASIVSNAMDTALANSDSDVATYFENMYPALKSVVSGWKFDVAFDTNTDDLQSKVQTILDDLKDENGRQLTTEEIFDLGAENAQYQNLISIAHSYNMTLEEMIALLRERNLVSDMDYQGLVGLFGQENIDSLTPEDIEIAYQIKNIGSLTFDELVAEIQRIKDEAADVNVDLSASVSQLIDQLNTQLKPAFDSLKSAYQDIFADNKFNLNAVDIPMLEKIKSDIEDLNNLEDVDININMDDFDTFAKILTDVNTTKKQAQQAFDDLATAIFNATGATEGMTDETVQLVEQLLESLGVVNAHEVALQALNEAKARAVIASYDLIEASKDEYVAILNEAVAAGTTRQEIYRLIAAEIAFGNNDLSVEQKINKLKELAKAYGDTATSALATAIANDLASGHTDVDSALNTLMTQINAGLNKVDIDFSGIEKSASKTASSTAKKFTDALDKELAELDKRMEVGYIDFNDYIQARLKLIEDYYRQGKISADEYYSYLNKHYDTQLSYIDKVVNAVTRRIDKEIDGLEKQKDDIESYYQVQIDSLEKEKTLLEEANKERQRQIDLQKALYDMERARNQRTKLVKYMPDTIVI